MTKNVIFYLEMIHKNSIHGIQVSPHRRSEGPLHHPLQSLSHRVHEIHFSI